VPTADFNVDDFRANKQREADKGLLVKFYVKARQDKKASAKAGRPVFDDVDYISIMVPGIRAGGVARPASARDIARFPEHYKAFKDRTAEVGSNMGTPLAEWPLVTRGQVEEMAFLRIKTVEQLAAVSDANSANIMGFHTLKAKALVWIETAEAGKAAADLQAELDKRDVQIAELTAAVEKLTAAKPAVRKKTTRKKASKKKVTKKKE
jgi:hypothetical protein